MLIDQLDLRVRLTDLALDDINRRGLARRNRLVVFVRALIAFGDRLQAFEEKVAVLERREQLALGHGVACARRRILYEAVVWRHHSPAHLSLDLRVGVDPVDSGRERQEDRSGEDCSGDKLSEEVARADQPLDLLPEALADLNDQQAIVQPLFLEDWRDDR